MGYLVLLAVVLTYLFINYIEPRLSMLHEKALQDHDLYIHYTACDKQRLSHQITAEECEIVRHYPELKQQEGECSRVIGFNQYDCYPNEDELCEEDEDFEIVEDKRLKSKFKFGINKIKKR